MWEICDLGSSDATVGGGRSGARLNKSHGFALVRSSSQAEALVVCVCVCVCVCVSRMKIR